MKRQNPKLFKFSLIAVAANLLILVLAVGTLLETSRHTRDPNIGLGLLILLSIFLTVFSLVGVGLSYKKQYPKG